MKLILVILPVISLVYGALSGNISEVSSAALDKAGEAVTLALSLCGIMCLWCGLMRVAEASGVVEAASKLMSPVISLLFRGLKKGGRAAQLISMNITANVLGLGNATTPLGIKAMQAIAEEENAADGTASDNMIMLTVLNTASLQVIPTTAAALRAAQGAAQPMEILPCVWIVSLYAAAVTVGAAKLMGFISRWRAAHELH